MLYSVTVKIISEKCVHIYTFPFNGVYFPAISQRVIVLYECKYCIYYSMAKNVCSLYVNSTAIWISKYNTVIIIIML